MNHREALWSCMLRCVGQLLLEERQYFRVDTVCEAFHAIRDPPAQLCLVTGYRLFECADLIVKQRVILWQVHRSLHSVEDRVVQRGIVQTHFYCFVVRPGLDKFYVEKNTGLTNTDCIAKRDYKELIDEHSPWECRICAAIPQSGDPIEIRRDEREPHIPCKSEALSKAPVSQIVEEKL